MLTAPRSGPPAPSPLTTRLGAIAELCPSDAELLRAAERQTRKVPPRRELAIEGEPIRERRAIVSGWALRQRILIDGRRQVLGFLLPGDLLGVCARPDPIAVTTVVTATEVETCPVPDSAHSPGLARAYALSAALEEWHLFAHLVRLGRMNAAERVIDLLLEFGDRTALAGSSGDSFPMPLTQELLADALGLTSVHVNRTLQSLRRDDMLVLRSGLVSLPDRARLAALVDHRSPRITAA